MLDHSVNVIGISYVAEDREHSFLIDEASYVIHCLTHVITTSTLHIFALRKLLLTLYLHCDSPYDYDFHTIVICVQL